MSIDRHVAYLWYETHFIDCGYSAASAIYDSMRFSVVIPTFKRPELLANCLQCLAGYMIADPQTQGFEVEVIVTDDEAGSPNAARFIEQYPQVIWNQGPSKGPASNRNSGASIASGDCIVFLDDDCLPQAGWLEAYLPLFKSGALLEGRTIADREQLRFNEESPVNETGGYLWSCNFALDREVFLELNGFDEGYIYAAMEDVDFRERLHDLGYLPEFVPEALVVHPWRTVAGIGMLRRRLLSHDIFWEKNPRLEPTSRFRFFFLMFARGVLKNTLKHLFRFRGRGLLFNLSNNTYIFYWALRNLGK